MHILFLKFLNNMCMTDLFLLLCMQAIVFGVHIFTFHITIFLLFYDMTIGIQAIFEYTRHPTLKSKQTNGNFQSTFRSPEIYGDYTLMGIADTQFYL